MLALNVLYAFSPFVLGGSTAGLMRRECSNSYSTDYGSYSTKEAIVKTSFC